VAVTFVRLYGQDGGGSSSSLEPLSSDGEPDVDADSPAPPPPKKKASYFNKELGYLGVGITPHASRRAICKHCALPIDPGCPRILFAFHAQQLTRWVHIFCCSKLRIKNNELVEQSLAKLKSASYPELLLEEVRIKVIRDLEEGPPGTIPAMGPGSPPTDCELCGSSLHSNGGCPLARAALFDMGIDVYARSFARLGRCGRHLTKKVITITEKQVDKIRGNGNCMFSSVAVGMALQSLEACPPAAQRTELWSSQLGAQLRKDFLNHLADLHEANAEIDGCPIATCILASSGLPIKRYLQHMRLDLPSL
jgi:hypothetical protein